MPQRNFIIIMIAVTGSYACYVRAEQGRYGRYLSQAITAIDRFSLERVPQQTLFEGAMRGMVGELTQRGDIHSAFIPARDTPRFDAELTQQFGGIGVEVRLLGEPPELTVVNPPLADTPAQRAGIRFGDRIVAVEGKPTTGRTLNDVIDEIRGPVGEPVELSILHKGEDEPVTVTVTRAIIDTPSVLGDARDDNGNWQFRLVEDPRIGYVRIANFGSKTAEELAAAFHELEDEHIEALVIDVRDDPGGALSAAVEVTDLLLAEGQLIVTVRGRDDVLEESYFATGEGRFLDIPIVVLTNSETASASEILAASLQDHHRAVVVGERSYGKGTVQQVLPTEGGRSLLKLTAASYHRPSGKNIHRRSPETPEDEDWGVLPNEGLKVVLSDEEETRRREDRAARDHFGPGRPRDNAAAGTGDEDETSGDKTARPAADRQLQRAVEYLRKRMKDDKR